MLHQAIFLVTCNATSVGLEVAKKVANVWHPLCNLKGFYTSSLRCTLQGKLLRVTWPLIERKPMVAFDYDRWINYIMWFRKQEKYELHRGNSSLEKLVHGLIFNKKSRLQKSKDRFCSIVRIFLCKPVWFGSIAELSRTQSRDLVRLKYSSIGFRDRLTLLISLVPLLG